MAFSIKATEGTQWEGFRNSFWWMTLLAVCERHHPLFVGGPLDGIGAGGLLVEGCVSQQLTSQHYNLAKDGSSLYQGTRERAQDTTFLFFPVKLLRIKYNRDQGWFHLLLKLQPFHILQIESIYGCKIVHIVPYSLCLNYCQQDHRRYLDSINT